MTSVPTPPLAHVEASGSCAGKIQHLLCDGEAQNKTFGERRPSVTGRNPESKSSMWTGLFPPRLYVAGLSEVMQGGTEDQRQRETVTIKLHMCWSEKQERQTTRKIVMSPQSNGNRQTTQERSCLLTLY